MRRALVLLILLFPAVAVASTLSDLRAGVRSILEEPNAVNFTDTEINRWINDGQRVLCSMLSDDVLYGVTSETTQSVVVNQREYVLPADFFRLVQCKVNGRYCDKVTLADLRAYDGDNTQKTSTTRSPAVYVFNGRFGVLPTPGSAQSAYEIELWYVREPDVLAADTNESALPTETHELMELYGAWKGSVKDSLFEAKAAPLWAMFANRVQAINAKYSGVHKSDPRPK